jgi:aspartate kinase
MIDKETEYHRLMYHEGRYMRIIQKFGGTSLGGQEKLQSVVRVLKQYTDHQYGIIVSAFSHTTKEEGTTSKLLDAIALAQAHQPYHHILQHIQVQHLTTIEGWLTAPSIVNEISLGIDQEIQLVRRVLDRIAKLGEVSCFDENTIIGAGERLAARFLTGVLKHEGLNAVYIDLSEVAPFDENSVAEAIIPLDLYNQVEQRLAYVLEKRLNQSEIPVVTGYIGQIPGGILTQIGRGYSDFTASLAASAIQADELWIWKEVDGIFSTDPTLCTDAQLLTYITPQEASELAYFGSEVIHPFTMERAIQASIPVRVRNTFRTEIHGTKVIHPPLHEQTPKGITAIAVKKDVHVVSIRSNQLLSPSDFLSRVFALCQQLHLRVDLISTSEGALSMAIEASPRIDDLKAELRVYGELKSYDSYTILTLVGTGIRMRMGISGEMISLLKQNKIPVEMIAHGASKVSISCVLCSEYMKDALSILHQHFIGSNPNLKLVSQVS